MRLYQLERLGLSKEPNLGNETFSTKMAHCAVPEILVNLYSMLGSSWNSIALGLNESSFWPYDYHFTHFLEKFIVLCIFRDIPPRRLKVAILKFSLMYLINGGFHLVAKIIKELKSHMILYKF